eukprot:GHVR01090615.1.p1 GENE.GHVR01090615.1~~GHVR01090615.1.p1  ORF type:complete len:156 (+),score=10.57 GHVR01090615.1:61-528(+)
MTLIHRFNASEEHARFLSTAQNDQPRGNAVWYNGLCPSLEEVQQVLRRMRTDPDLSQEKIFWDYAPIFIFGCFIMGLAITLRKGVIPSPAGRSSNALVLAGVILAFIIFFAFALVRTVIWSIANGIGMFVEMNFDEAKDGTFQLSERSVLLGGLF